MDTKPKVVYEGKDPINYVDVRVVLTTSGDRSWPIAERQIGHDACGQPHWEQMSGANAAEVIAAAALHVALQER